MYVNTKLIGAIAFIMVFTYSAEAIVFGDTSEIDKVTTETDFGSLMSKETYFNTMYTWSIAVFLNNTKNYITHFPSDATTEQKRFYFTLSIIPNIFYNYKTGVDVYNALPLKTGGILSVQKSQMDELYTAYTLSKGYNPDGTVRQQTVFQAALEFLGRIPEAFGKFIEILTFNIKNQDGDNAFPIEVVFVLNLFFIPMWIILSIELLPILAKIIEAIGALIPF
jgi:hypothetical protein